MRSGCIPYLAVTAAGLTADYPVFLDQDDLRSIDLLQSPCDRQADGAATDNCMCEIRMFHSRRGERSAMTLECFCPIATKDARHIRGSDISRFTTRLDTSGGGC